jgi:hypothetical protein
MLSSAFFVGSAADVVCATESGWAEGRALAALPERSAASSEADDSGTGERVGAALTGS